MAPPFSLYDNVAAATRFLVNSSGNVGIGTTDPKTALDVNGTIKLGTGTCSSTTQGSLQFTSNSVQYCNTSNTWTTLGSGGSSQWVTNGSDIGFATGKVGVGTTAPTHTLTVLKDQNASTAFMLSNSNSGASAEASIYLKNDAGNPSYLGVASSGNSAGAVFQNRLTLGASNSHGGVSVLSEAAGGDFRVLTGGYAQANERMRIDSSGNVGIGLTNPTNKLHVNGSFFASGGATISGNLALGNTISNSNGTAASPAYSFVYGANTGMFLTANGSETLGFSTAGTERMRISNTGYVGIGVTSPSYPFHMRASGYGQAVFESSNDHMEMDLGAYGTGKQSMLFLSAARGTKASPTYLQSGDSIGYIGASPAQGGAQASRIMFSATAAWSGTSTPGNIVFATTPVNSTVPVNRAEFTDTGILTIANGAASTTPLLDVNAPIKMSPQGTSTGQGGEARFQELTANGAHYSAIRAPDSLAASYVLTLPVDDGNSNQVLTTNGSGVLSWSTVATANGTFSANNGTASAPTFTFSGDANNGMYLAGADSVGFSTAGVNRMTIDATGNVGVGGTSANDKFYVDETTTSTTTGWDQTIFGWTKIAPTSPSSAQIINGYFAADFQGTANSPNAQISGVIGDASNNSSKTLGQANSFVGPIFGNGGTTNTAVSFNGWGEVNNGATITDYKGMYIAGYVNSGTILGSTGVYISDLPGTNYQFGIYQAGATDKNYFAGNIGIGTTNPATKLDVNGTIKLGTGTCGASTQGSLQFTSNSVQYCNTSNVWTTLGGGSSGDVVKGGNTQSSGTMTIGTNDAYPFGVETNGVTRMLIDSSGNAVIGSDLPKTDFALKLYRGASGYSAITMHNSTYTNGFDVGLDPNSADSFVWNNNGGWLQFGTSAVDRMTILSNGNIGIANTNAAYKLDITGDLNLRTGSVFRINGTQICSSSGCTSSSDLSLKKNVKLLEGSLEKIVSLQGVEYDWKNTEVFGDQHQVGLIAQDLEKVFPEVVVTDKDSGLKSVAYDHLIAPVIEAIKTLYAKVTDNSREIASLKERAEKAEQENAAMKAYLCSKDPSAPICK